MHIYHGQVVGREIDSNWLAWGVPNGIHPPNYPTGSLFAQAISSLFHIATIMTKLVRQTEILVAAFL